MKRKPANSQVSQFDSRGDYQRIVPIGMHRSLADSVRRIVRRALRLREPTSSFESKIRDEARRLRVSNGRQLTKPEIEQMVVNLILDNCYGVSPESGPQRCHRADLDTQLATADNTIEFD